MAERWCGFVATKDEVNYCDIETDGPEVSQLVAHNKFAVQTGPRPAAYAALYERIRRYVQEHGVSRVVVQASATTGRSARMSHLQAAEVRGVATAAAVAGGAEVDHRASAVISRTFGTRKVDEYVADDGFWAEQFPDGGPTKGRRKAALLVLDALAVADS